MLTLLCHYDRNCCSDSKHLNYCRILWFGRRYLWGGTTEFRGYVAVDGPRHFEDGGIPS